MQETEAVVRRLRYWDLFPHSDNEDAEAFIASQIEKHTAVEIEMVDGSKGTLLAAYRELFALEAMVYLALSKSLALDGTEGRGPQLISDNSRLYVLRPDVGTDWHDQRITRMMSAYLRARSKSKSNQLVLDDIVTFRDTSYIPIFNYVGNNARISEIWNGPITYDMTARERTGGPRVLGQKHVAFTRRLKS